MCPAKRVPHLPMLGRFGRRRCLGAFASRGGIKGDRNFTQMYHLGTSRGTWYTLLRYCFF